MNFAEARAQFQVDARRLAKLGIILPGARMYLPDDWKQDYSVAMDGLRGIPGLAFDATPGPMVTDPNSAIPSILTTTVDPELIRIVFSPLDFAKILGERQVGDWTMDARMFPIIENTGEISSYGDFNANGRVGVNFNYPWFQSYLFQTFVRYGEREIDRAGLMKINYVSELNAAGATILNTYQNLTYAFGVQSLQCYGVLNNPFLAAALTPATKANSGTGWFSGNNPNATANEVYNDVVALVNSLISQTNGALNMKSPMKLCMGPNSEVALTFTNAFGINVGDLLKKNYPNMEVMTAPQYGARSTTNPQGYSTAGNFMQLIAKSFGGQDVVYAAYPEKLRAHKMINEPSAWQQKFTSGTWGTILRAPVAITSMIGI